MAVIPGHLVRVQTGLELCPILCKDLWKSMQCHKDMRSLVVLGYPVS